MFCSPVFKSPKSIKLSSEQMFCEAAELAEVVTMIECGSHISNVQQTTELSSRKSPLLLSSSVPPNQWSEAYKQMSEAHKL